MVDEQDIDGWVETDGGVEFDTGGVVERDAAAGGVEVAATVDELALTEYNPNVSKAISLTAGLDELTLTEYNPTVTLGISVSAGVDALILTEYNPTVSKAISFIAGVDELVITEYNPTVSKAISFTAGVDALILTEYAATVSKAISITAGLDELVITEYNPVVTVGIVECPEDCANCCYKILVWIYYLEGTCGEAKCSDYNGVYELIQQGAVGTDCEWLYTDPVDGFTIRIYCELGYWWLVIDNDGTTCAKWRYPMEAEL